MSKKTTVTELFDEDGRLVSRETVTEDVYTPYCPHPGGWVTPSEPLQPFRVTNQTLHG